MTVTMTFNGYDFSRDFIPLCDSRPLPEFRDTSTVVSGADGESFDGLTVGTREFTITLVAVNKEPKALQTCARTLMDVLAVRSPKAFTFSDERDSDGTQLVRYAVPTGAFDAQEFIKAGKWTCRFKQHDPYLYGKSRSVVLKPNQAQKISVGGNVPTWPTVTSKPSGSYFTISDGSNRYVKFAAAFNGSTTLTLDFEKSRASLSASLTGSGLLVGSRFFEIDDTVELKATSTTTVSWHERWL